MNLSRWHIVVVGMLVATVTAFHYLTPLNMPSLHVVYRELYFVPIILAALWGGRKGGLSTSVVVSLIYIPHVFFLAKPHPAFDRNMMLNILATSAESLWGNVFELLFYNLVGYFLGLMIENIEREHRARLESERLATVGKTVAEIAHDMKAPLMAIGGFSAQLEKAVDRDDPASQKKLTIIHREAGRLEGMIKEMLDFSRPLELNRSSVSLNQVASESVSLLGSIAEEAAVELQKELSPSLPSLMVDVEKVKQVVLNLVTNAIQACDRGDTVTVRTYSSDGFVSLDVIDCGPGIPIEDQEKIFQPFFSKKRGGTGLGLPNVKKIVEAHRGTVSFHSNPKGGSTFRVEFKIDEP